MKGSFSCHELGVFVLGLQPGELWEKDTDDPLALKPTVPKGSDLPRGLLADSLQSDFGFHSDVLKANEAQGLAPLRS